MAIRETAYNTLARVAIIKDEDERINALRAVLQQRPALVSVFKYTYDKTFEMGLPEGRIPADRATESRHDDPAPFYYNVRRLRVFSQANMTFEQREVKFINIYESISSQDIDLLIGIKDKKLPWETLNAEFAYKALPELFPEDIQMEIETVKKERGKKNA